jgi:hypothetical protein
MILASLAYISVSSLLLSPMLLLLGGGDRFISMMASAEKLDDFSFEPPFQDVDNAGLR